MLWHSRLLEEKEKDLELAAKIGQELLERNRILEEKVSHLETQVSFSTEALTQLRHELQVKTDLLRAFSNDEAGTSGGEDDDEASPVELRKSNIDVLQRKIAVLEKDNRRLHEEATEVRPANCKRFLRCGFSKMFLVKAREDIKQTFYIPTHFSPFSLAAGEGGNRSRGEGGKARLGRRQAPDRGQRSDQLLVRGVQRQGRREPEAEGGNNPPTGTSIKAKMREVERLFLTRG